MEPIIIGIAGGTGSGKSTLANRLVDNFGEDEISIIRHDNYYKSQDHISYEERVGVNYDHPDAFESDLLCKHLYELKKGRSVQIPIYDFTKHTRSNETITINPAPVIIIEGILIFSERKLCNMMNIKVFVDTDADVRVLRRINRDVRKRGRTLESVISQYLTTVKPMHEQFVEPSKRKADIIIPEGGKNPVALEMLVQRIKSVLKENKKDSTKYQADIK